jgi:WD40 repeat protein
LYGQQRAKDGLQCRYLLRGPSSLSVISLDYSRSYSQENIFIMITAAKKAMGMEQARGHGLAIWLPVFCIFACGITGQRRAVAGILGFGATSGQVAKLEFQLKERYEPTSVAWSPDGRYIATGSTTDQRIDIWDVSQRKIVKVLFRKFPPAFFHELTWSPNSRYLTFCDAPGVLRLYRTSDWTEAHVFSGPPGGAGCTQSAFSSDSSQVALLGTYFLGVYEIAGWRTLKSLNLSLGWGRGDLFDAVAYSPQSHSVLLAGGQYVTLIRFGHKEGSWEGRVWLFRPEDEVPSQSIHAYRAGDDRGGGADVLSLAVSPDGAFIATGAKTGAGIPPDRIATESVHLLRVSDGRLIGAPLDGVDPMKFGADPAIAITHDGRYIISPHKVRDGWIHVIDGRTFKVVDLVKADGFCFDVAVNQVNDEFAVGAGNRVTVWSLPRR